MSKIKFFQNENSAQIEISKRHLNISCSLFPEYYSQLRIISVVKYRYKYEDGYSSFWHGGVKCTYLRLTEQNIHTHSLLYANTCTIHLHFVQNEIERMENCMYIIHVYDRWMKEMISQRATEQQCECIQKQKGNNFEVEAKTCCQQMSAYIKK